MKPILFNTEMVRAILEGRKTVTRRIVKPQPQSKYKYKLGYVIDSTDKRNEGRYAFGTHEYGGQCCYAKPPYEVGDVLYVRETWGNYGDGTPLLYKADYPDGATTYKHDDGIHMCDLPKWKPSIHMPKAAARIFLRVTSVRVERLQDITPEQAIKEGTKENFPPLAVDEFRDIWQNTIKKDQAEIYSWEANPYVWVIEFERVEGKCSD